MQENNEIKVDLNAEISPDEVAKTEEMLTENEQNDLSSEQQEKNNSQIEDLQNSLVRLKADFDNYKRRTQMEREQLATFVTADVVAKILPVLDSFKRAHVSLPSSTEPSVVTGLEMILKQFEQAFTDIGVEKISTEGKFNPELHEAMMRGENPELEDGSIEMVFEEGYIYKGKVVRHSKVKVIG